MTDISDDPARWAKVLADSRRARLLAIILAASPRGIPSRDTWRRLNDALPETPVNRETVHRWLADFEALGLTTRVRAGNAHGWAVREAPAPVPEPLPAQAAGIVTVLSGCMYCHRLIARGKDSDPWRTLPDRFAPGDMLRAAADMIACAASPDDRHHALLDSPGRSGTLADEPWRAALAHLSEM